MFLKGVLLVYALISVCRCETCEEFGRIEDRRDGGTYCCNIKCGPGYFPVMCRPGEPTTSSCVMCSHHHYSNDVLYLYHQEKCKMKTRCHPEDHEGLKYDFIGNRTHDAKCGCQSGYLKTEDEDGTIQCERKIKPQDGKSMTSPTQGFQHPKPHFLKKHTGILIVFACLAVGLLLGIFLFFQVRKRCSNEDDIDSTEDSDADYKEKCLSETTHPPSLTKDENKRVLTYIIGRKIQKLLKTIETAVKVLKNLFGPKMDDDTKAIYEDAKHELKKASDKENTLGETMTEAFKRWHTFRGEEATCYDLLDAIKKEGIDCRSLINDIKMDLRISVHT